MIALFFLASIIVGITCGAAIGLETRDLRNQPTGLRPWLIFFGVALIVAGCCAVVSYISEHYYPSASIKGMAIITGAVVFTATLFWVRRPR